MGGKRTLPSASYPVAVAPQSNLETLGLCGDGDELDDLRNVEERYADLLKVLSEQAAQTPDTWIALPR